MPRLPGLDADVSFGEPEKALPAVGPPEDDDFDEPTAEEREATTAVLGFDPAELWDDSESFAERLRARDGKYALASHRGIDFAAYLERYDEQFESLHKRASDGTFIHTGEHGPAAPTPGKGTTDTPEDRLTEARRLVKDLQDRIAELGASPAVAWKKRQLQQRLDALMPFLSKLEQQGNPPARSQEAPQTPPGAKPVPAPVEPPKAPPAQSQTPEKPFSISGPQTSEGAGYDPSFRFEPTPEEQARIRAQDYRKRLPPGSPGAIPSGAPERPAPKPPEVAQVQPPPPHLQQPTAAELPELRGTRKEVRDAAGVRALKLQEAAALRDKAVADLKAKGREDQANRVLAAFRRMAFENRSGVWLRDKNSSGHDLLRRWYRDTASAEGFTESFPDVK